MNFEVMVGGLFTRGGLLSEVRECVSVEEEKRRNCRPRSWDGAGAEQLQSRKVKNKGDEMPGRAG